MIVVLSDLHLQHTSLDVVRRAEGGRVLETKVLRNVGAGALELLFSEIVENVERCDAKVVHLVFAGDIFELLRTPLWFSNGEQLRPTLYPALQSKPLEAKVLAILAAIERDNREFFRTLAEFVQSGSSVRRGEQQTLVRVPVIPHFIPGNHDRTLSLWPSTRRKVRELLCMPEPRAGAGLDAPFPRRLDWDRSAGYGVRIRHGHEYDRASFSQAFDPREPPPDEVYDRPCLGDFVTIDIATRLAVAFRAHYARQLRAPGSDGDQYRKVYAALTEFDDVRPQSMLVHYLTHAVGANEKRTLAMLRPVLRDVFETAAADSFFVSESHRLELDEYFEGGLAKLIEASLTTLDGAHVVSLMRAIEAFRGESRQGGPASVARNEPGLETGELSVIIAGHTHDPDQVALPGEGASRQPGKEAYFLDTGTWRTRIDAGEAGVFGRLRGYTMVFCYHDDELRPGERRRFESWTGHLQAEDYGPLLSFAVPEVARPPRQNVRFVECQIQHVDEGETMNGAELVVYFGLDGEGGTQRFDGVHDGDVLAFPTDTTVSVDPALDGEAWCYGVERDVGDSLLDRDDPLPWSVAFLPRTSDAANAPFAAGRVQLRAADNRGNAFSLTLEVS